MPAMMLWISVGIATSLRFMQILRFRRVLFVVTCCGRLVASFLGGLVIRHIQAAARRSPRQRLLMGSYISCLFAMNHRWITLVYLSLSFSSAIRFLHPIIPSLITSYRLSFAACQWQILTETVPSTIGNHSTNGFPVLVSSWEFFL